MLDGLIARSTDIFAPIKQILYNKTFSNKYLRYQNGTKSLLGSTYTLTSYRHLNTLNLCSILSTSTSKRRSSHIYQKFRAVILKSRTCFIHRSRFLRKVSALVFFLHSVFSMYKAALGVPASQAAEFYKHLLTVKEHEVDLCTTTMPG